MSVTIEEALIDLGDKPLVKSPYSKAIKAVVNAALNDPNTVTLVQTGDALLTMLYHLPDPVVKQQLLNKDLGGVRDKDSYRTVLLGFATLIVVIAISMTVVMLMNTTGDNSANASLLEKIVGGVFDVLKAIIGRDDTSSP